MNKVKTATILIVDDVPKNIQVVANILKNGPYKISFATDGRSTLDYCQKFHYDLILLDIMMPEMDGIEVCKTLKENNITKNIPVIFITARGDTDTIIKGFEAGGVDYVTKPFTAEELLARVKTHLKLKQNEDELRELNKAKNKFFSIIAHDLKGPVSSINKAMNLLLYEDITEEGRIEIMKELKDISTRTFSLIENLLDWAKIQRNTIALNPSFLEVKLSFDETVQLLLPQAKDKNISIIKEIDKDLKIFADERMLKTVFRNLISNAIKFTGFNGNIIIKALKANENIEISITDNGVGISEERFSELFRLGEKISTEGTAGERGTGLGLILCKEFVEKNNGKITLKSKLDEGSSFILTFPLSPKQE